MESTRLFSAIRGIRVRERVRKFFNPEEFIPRAFRDALTLGLLGLLLAEVVVFTKLQQSAELGELPHDITDAAIMGTSLLEFLVIPVISGLGSQRRRSVLVGWTIAALLCTVPLFGLPDPDITVDPGIPGLCSATVVPLHHQFPFISAKTALRLSMLLICGAVSALARAVFISHGIAYLNEHNPSDNLHMHVGIFLVHRVMIYLFGRIIVDMVLEQLWVQVLIITIKLLITLLRLYRYPEAAPVVEKEHRNGKGVFRSMARVLGNRMAVLQILAMSLLAAAWWGFGINETAFVLVKYYIRPDNDVQMGILNLYIRMLSVLLAVILAGFIYTNPVMPKFDRRDALFSAVKMCLIATVAYVLMTYMLDCNRGEVGGLGERNYTQPACGLNCCDQPWIQFTPVCVPEQMTTYFSPCHAGCAISDTVNSVGVYSNCACAADGHVIKGACDDGSCLSGFSMHQMFFVLASLTSTLAMAWQTTVMLESVEKRDVGVAVGLASGAISLFAFTGAHGFYMGISAFTCAYAPGPKCLLQDDSFISWVGYSSAVFAGLSLIITIACWILLRPQKKPENEHSSLCQCGDS